MTTSIRLHLGNGASSKESIARIPIQYTMLVGPLQGKTRAEFEKRLDKEGGV